MSYIEVMGYITVFTLYTTNKKQNILPHGAYIYNIFVKSFSFYIHNTIDCG